MGRVRSRSSLLRAWFVALSASCLVAVALPLQFAGATDRDPVRDPGGDPTCLPDDLSCLPDGGGGSSTTPPPSSDLSITKTAVEDTALTGEQQAFLFTITNAGPDPSGAPITVTDELPAGLTFDPSDSSSDCSAAGQTVTCLRGPVAAGESASDLAIVATVGADAAPNGTPTTQTNTATVTGANVDPNTANNTSSASYGVFPLSDLTASKTHTGSFTVGFFGTWTITVHNDGPGFAPGSVFVEDELPEGFDFVQVVGDANGWDCRPNGLELSKFACEHVAALEVGDSLFTAQVFVTSEATPDGVAAQATNNVTVADAANETNKLNNGATDTADVDPSADLRLTKSHTGNFTHGQHGTYTLSVTNDGPAAAVAPITVRDTLPTGWGYIASGSGGNGWTCDTADVPPMPNQPRIVTCIHAGDLASGAQAPFPLVVDVPNDLAAAGPAIASNDAVVTSPTPDPALENNFSFDLTRVVDVVPPTITVPGDITQSNDPGLATAAVTFTTVATDNYPGTTVACNPPSGTAFPLGATTVTCTATDTSGNTDSDSFEVTVNDTEPPSITVPADVTKSTDPGLATAVVTYAPTAADNAPGVTVACVPPPGTAFAIGTTSVTCTATDTAGNTDSDSFDVTVVDTEPPSLTVPADITQSTDPGLATAAVTYSATASDNVPGVAKACAPPSGTAFPLGTTGVTCTATDVAGNTTSKSFNVTVVDNEPPSLTVPANMTVNATSPAGAVVTYAVSASDNAPGVTVACVPPSGATFAISTTTVNCTATDGAGNTASKSFQVKVIGAVDQINNLINVVKGMTIEPGFKSELLNKLNAALKAASANNKGKACSELAKFLDSVNSKSGKKILAGNAATLTTDANRIRAVLAC
jgi:uncharacterized repeat protein (TIGR01451 family)